MHHLQRLFPSFRNTAVRMLSDHLSSLLVDNERNISAGSMSSLGRSLGVGQRAGGRGQSAGASLRGLLQRRSTSLGLELHLTQIDLDACLDLAHRCF